MSKIKSVDVGGYLLDEWWRKMHGPPSLALVWSKYFKADQDFHSLRSQYDLDEYNDQH